jgi:hypothetical protein
MNNSFPIHQLLNLIVEPLIFWSWGERDGHYATPMVR